MMVGRGGFGNGCGDAVAAESDADNQRLDMVSSFWLGQRSKYGFEQVNDDNAIGRRRPINSSHLRKIQ